MKKIVTLYLFFLMLFNVLGAWIMLACVMEWHTVYQDAYSSGFVDIPDPTLHHVICWPYILALLAAVGCVRAILVKHTPYLIHLVILLLWLDICYGAYTIFIYVSPFYVFMRGDG